MPIVMFLGDDLAMARLLGYLEGAGGICQDCRTPIATQVQMLQSRTDPSTSPRFIASCGCGTSKTRFTEASFADYCYLRMEDINSPPVLGAFLMLEHERQVTAVLSREEMIELVGYVTEEVVEETMQRLDRLSEELEALEEGESPSIRFSRWRRE